MKFSKQELEKLFNDIQGLLEEFEEMTPEERQASSVMEQDVSSIQRRLQEYDQLSDDERKLLHQHIYTLYNFLGEAPESEGNFEGRLQGKLNEISDALDSVVKTVKGPIKQEYGSMSEMTGEMNAIVQALSGSDTLTKKELEEIEKKLKALEKKFDDTYPSD